jgi:cell division transport system permease protein
VDERTDKGIEQEAGKAVEIETGKEIGETKELDAFETFEETREEIVIEMEDDEQEESKFLDFFVRFLKFTAAAILCAGAVLTMNMFFQEKDRAASLYADLNFHIFLNKNLSEIENATVQNISNLDLLDIVEYVPSNEVYKRAVEKNPFLGNVSVPNVATVFQSYIVATPATILTAQALKTIEDAFYGMESVDELVFDKAAFLQFIALEEKLKFYQKAGYILAGAFAALFLIEFVIFMFAAKEKRKKFLLSFCICFIGAIAGFWLLQGLSAYINYALTVDQISALLAIPFTTFATTLTSQ